MSEMDEVLKDFLVESAENLDRLDREFIELEASPDRLDLLASIFRTIHTIKGTCGFFGLQRLERLTHAGESLLSRLRDGARAFTPACAAALLRLVDAVRTMLGNIAADGTDGVEEYPALISVLERLAAGEEPELDGVARSQEAPEPDAAPSVAVAPPAGKPAAAPVVVSAAPVAPPAVVSVSAPPPVVPAPAPPVTPPAAAPRAGPDEPERGALNARPAPDATVRVDVAVLDNLMVLVGELVLARNQALQFSRGTSDVLQGAYLRIDHVTASLQEAVMRTRMLPLGNLLNRYPRVVRDLATQCGKLVRVEVEGAETALDRTLLEAIKDPLTHIVRNAIDHGLEAPSVRLAAGKLAAGRLRLRGFHEGGRVTIEISDDGGGIDVAKVRRRAIERGLLTEATAARLTDAEALEIIFMPGFSTADTVTKLSGRGVGMDVVRTNIRALGGTVDIDSTLGVGTRIQLRVPLTVAIVPALIVRAASERFAIPQVSVQEIIRLTPGGPTLEQVHGVPVYRLRDHLLPILPLARLFGLPAEPSEDQCIVVLLVGRQPFGILLDGVADQIDIVVKPIGKSAGVPGLFAGATVLGDGTVALILDVAGLAQRAQMGGRPQDGPSVERAAVGARESDRLLLFTGPDRTQLMIPLADVTRIEEIAPARVEREADGHVVQYRGRVMPLVALDGGFYGSQEADLSTPLHVLVHTGPRGDIGVVVDQVLDVVDVAIVERRPSSRPGVRFSAIVRDRVTQMLAIEEIVRQRVPLFYEPLGPEAA